MGQRIALWLIVLALCSPLVLMAWYPTTFSVALQFALRNSLDLVLLLCLAVLIAREAHSRTRNGYKWSAAAAVAAASLGSAWYYHIHQTIGSVALAMCVPGFLLIPIYLFGAKR
jgi:hypothetical protein